MSSLHMQRDNVTHSKLNDACGDDIKTDAFVAVFSRQIIFVS
jgi:hypothetical protein